MRSRDYDYIEGRLLSPCTEAGEARTRLSQAGEGELAGRLLEAEQAFIDECRAIRRALAEKQDWHRP